MRRPNWRRARCVKSEAGSETSMFGNSQRLAFTTDAGRWRTRKRLSCSTTNATKRGAVAERRKEEGGCRHVADVLRVWDEEFRQAPKRRVGVFLSRVLPEAEGPCQHADDIAVEDRRGLVETDAANRPGGVSADAGQGQDVVERFRKSSAVLGDDQLRGRPQIAGA